MSVVGLRTVHELRGISCISLERTAPPAKSVASTRSFGRPVTQLTELKQAVAMYCTIAAEKLRKDNQVAAAIKVFIHTNYHKPTDPQYANSRATKLDQPTSDTRKLIKAAHGLLIKIYKKGYKYKKAGIILTKLMPADQIQLDLLKTYKTDVKSKRLMKAVDKINERFGRDSCTSAAVGKRKPWQMRQNKKTGRFTTSWKELIKI